MLGSVALTGPINEAQRTVLHWIAAGCPADEMSGSAYKTTASALAARRLITVTKAGGQWKAELTAAGRHYVEFGNYPADHWATRGRRRSAMQPSTTPRVRNPSTTPEAGSAANAPERKQRPPDATARVTAERRTAASALIEELIAIGFKLVPGDDDDEVSEWRKTIDFAKRHAMVPDGHWIEKHHRQSGELRIVLCRGVHPNTTANRDASDTGPEAPQLHPLLAELADPSSVFAVSEESIPRILRFLHALLIECDARGFTTGWAPANKGAIRVQVDRLDVWIAITEESAVEHVMPTAEDVASRKLYSWQRVQPEPRPVASRLTVTVGGTSRHDRSTWSDGKRQRIENKVTAVVDRITERAQGLADFYAAQKLREQEQEHKRQAALDRAREEFLENRRVDTLNQQLTDWHKAIDIRAYCEARAHAAAAGNGDADSAADLNGWLAWCRAYADRIDPVRLQAPGPPVTEPTQADLQPFLPPWMKSRW